MKPYFKATKTKCIIKKSCLGDKELLLISPRQA